MSPWELTDQCPSCRAFLHGYENCPKCNMPGELIRQRRRDAEQTYAEKERRATENARYAEEWKRKQKATDAWARFVGVVLALLVLAFLYLRYS